MPENTSQQPENLMELLSKATSTHELPQSLFDRGKGLNDAKAILFLMQHFEGIKTSSPGTSK